MIIKDSFSKFTSISKFSGCIAFFTNEKSEITHLKKYLNSLDHKNLTELLQQLSTTDIVIVEGFKNDNHPKIEIIKEKSKNYLFNQISNVVALISDIEVDSNIRKFKKNEIELIVKFILNDL